MNNKKEENDFFCLAAVFIKVSQEACSSRYVSIQNTFFSNTLFIVLALTLSIEWKRKLLLHLKKIYITSHFELRFFENKDDFFL